MWLLFFFAARSSAASPTIRMTAREDLGANRDRDPEENGQGRIYSLVEAVNYLLNAYLTSNIIGNAVAKLSHLNNALDGRPRFVERFS